MASNLEWFRWVSLMTPKQVAEALIAGLDRETPEILVGWQSHLAVWCHRLFPFLMEKILLMAAPKVI
jgi:3-oxoacyl-[acyl-carrier protein] reductase